MKSIKYLAFCMLIWQFSNAASQSGTQSIFSDTVFYHYELEQTGKFTETGDTLYEVCFILKSEDLPTLKSMLVLKDDKETSITLTDKSIKEDARFTQEENRVKVRIEQWSNLSNCLVTGLNDKSEQVLMINAQDSKKTTTKVINTIITPVKRTRPPETIVRLSTK